MIDRENLKYELEDYDLNVPSEVISEWTELQVKKVEGWIGWVRMDGIPLDLNEEAHSVVPKCLSKYLDEIL